MLNIFNILYNFRACYLITINDENQLNVCMHNICNPKEAFLVIKASENFIGKSHMCDLTRMIGTHNFDYDGNTILVGCDRNDYILFSGFEIIKFKTEAEIIDFVSLMGYSMISKAIGTGEK